MRLIALGIAGAVAFAAIFWFAFSPRAGYAAVAAALPNFRCDQLTVRKLRGQYSWSGTTGSETVALYMPPACLRDLVSLAASGTDLQPARCNIAERCFKGARDGRWFELSFAGPSFPADPMLAQSRSPDARLRFGDLR